MEYGRRATVLSVANRKGGTGKSTTSVNLAAEFSLQGKRVLVIDLDPQGHAGLGLGIDASCKAPRAHEIYRNRNCHLEKAIMPSRVNGIDLITADPEFDGIVHIANPRHLASCLEPVLGNYDVILIDTPPGVPQLTVSALMASKAVLVPVFLEHLAYDGVLKFMASYFRVVSTYSNQLSGLLVVPMRIDLRSRMQEELLLHMQRGFGTQRMTSGIRVDVSVSEAFGRRQPIQSYRPCSRAASDFNRLSREVQAKLAMS